MTNPPLTITFLGTGTSSGVPMVGCTCPVCQSTNRKDKRYRSSILVQSASTTLVVDTGPDFRSQMLLNQVMKLDAALLTHAHKDHIAGLDDIRAYNFFQQKPMDVYGTAATLHRVKEEFYYAFSEKKFPGVPIINLHTIADSNFTVGDIEIMPFPVWHLYMPVTAFRFGDFTYITDANRIDEDVKEKIKGTQVLVLNTLRQESHLSHFTLSEGIALSDELEIPEVYFTHISHQMGLHDAIDKQLPLGKHLAYDGLVLNV